MVGFSAALAAAVRALTRRMACKVTLPHGGLQKSKALHEVARLLLQHRKVVVDTFALYHVEELVHHFVLFVQVVEHNHGEFLGIGRRQGEGVERRAHLVAQYFVVGFIFQYLLCAYPVVIFHSRLQFVQAYLVLDVKARFLPRQQRARRFKVGCVGAVLYPCVHHGVCLEHYGYSVIREVLQVRL